MSVILAASTGVIGTAIVLGVLFYLLPFYFARRIGLRKGRRWFWYALFFHWLGVLILALRRPTAWAASGGSSYHVPPDLAARRKGGRKTHWMYDQRRK
jgi:hypothetical protein